MSLTTRLAPRLRQLCSAIPPVSRSFTTGANLAKEEWPQRTPLGPYYESIIPASATIASPPQPSTEASPVPSPPPTSAQEKARIVFGTRLASPTDRAERLNALKSRSQYIAGVLVPPKPEEPDNCCMSGCVNCVWDLFREEMEEYTAKNKEAQARLQAAQSVDSDGGGSQEGLGVNVGDTKIAKDLWDEDVFKNVPVGIREFMKQEKRLKEQHEREGTSGG
ncbi:hypothetical protein NLU13_4337 [Sarocladium strictum]|uniref:Oxidoreductase-like domain-containing protein n=1 Tax=Sarocladium strictum TaxID=5046 RepID=A0AA39GK27_SARSR|nr:hypothetical protein NLU13_4337 [Sarocladium strictum]